MSMSPAISPALLLLIVIGLAAASVVLYAFAWRALFFVAGVTLLAMCWVGEKLPERCAMPVLMLCAWIARWTMRAHAWLDGREAGEERW